MTINYTKMITDAKVAARDILRSQKVSDLLKFIRTQENIISSLATERENVVKSASERILSIKKEIEKAQYRARIATETHNPEADEIVKLETKRIESFDADIQEAEQNLTQYLTAFDKNAEKVTAAANEKIAEYKTKIEAWNTGESKVCYETMKHLAEKLVESRITNKFLAGEYDSEETNN